MESGYVFFRDNACYNANTANERRIRIGWLFVTHMSIVRTYVRVDDKRGRGGTERGEGDRTVRKLRAYWSQPGETRVRGELRVCASRGALVRRWNAETGAPGPPHSPTDLLPSCASLCLSVTSRHFSLPYALPTYTCNACVCVYVYTRSFVDRLFTGFRV